MCRRCTRSAVNENVTREMCDSREQFASERIDRESGCCDPFLDPNTRKNIKGRNYSYASRTYYTRIVNKLARGATKSTRREFIRETQQCNYHCS